MVKRGLVLNKYAAVPKTLSVELEAGKKYILALDLQDDTWTTLYMEIE